MLVLSVQWEYKNVLVHENIPWSGRDAYFFLALHLVLWPLDSEPELICRADCGLGNTSSSGSLLHDHLAVFWLAYEGQIMIAGLRHFAGLGQCDFLEANVKVFLFAFCYESSSDWVFRWEKIFLVLRHKNFFESNRPTAKRGYSNISFSHLNLLRGML